MAVSTINLHGFCDEITAIDFDIIACTSLNLNNIVAIVIIYFVVAAGADDNLVVFCSAINTEMSPALPVTLIISFSAPPCIVLYLLRLPVPPEIVISSAPPPALTVWLLPPSIVIISLSTPPLIVFVPS